MTVKELKGYLSLMKDDEKLNLDIGGMKTELQSILYVGDKVYLAGHNYAMDDKEITRNSVLSYVHELVKDKEK